MLCNLKPLFVRLGVLGCERMLNVDLFSSVKINEVREGL